MRGDLTAEFRADRTAAAGNQDRLSGDEGINLLHVGPDRFTAEEIFHGDVFQIGDADFSLDQLKDAGKLFQFAVGLIADGEDFLFLYGGGAGDSEIDLIDFVLLNRRENVLAAADDGNTVQVTAPLVGIVVDEADDLVGCFFGLPEISQNHLAGRAGTDQHDAGAFFFRHNIDTAAENPKESIRKTDGYQKDELEESPQHIIGDRHPVKQQGDQETMQGGCDNGSKEGAFQLNKARKTPHAFVHAEKPENDKAEKRIGNNKAGIWIPVPVGNAGKLAVEAKPERQKPGCQDGNEVVDHQENGDHLPVLERLAPYAIWFSVFIIHNETGKLL